MSTRKLLFSITKKDFKITYFSGRGGGGQHRNKHQNCVRLTHIESGITTTGQSYRERHLNLKSAFKHLVRGSKFKIWHTKKVNELLNGKDLEEKVDRMMLPIDLKVECREDGEWRIYND